MGGLLPGMFILVTGADGFVGRHLMTTLKEQGHQALAFEGNICEKQAVLNFQPNQQEIDYIIHLAAVIGGKDRKIFQKVNVEGTRNVVELAKKLKVKKFIFLSSARALAARSDPYGDSKKSAEEIVKQSGLAYTILRPTIIYGPGGRKNIGLFINFIKKFRIAPIFNFKLQPVFVEDVVALISVCLNDPVNSEINLSGPVVTFKELIIEIKKIFPNFIILDFPAFFNFLLKSLSFLPFSPFPSWQVKTLLDNEIFENREWTEEFNIKERSLKEGLSQIL